MLPAVGIGVLLRYLPTKKYIAYLILGFAVAAYLGVPMLGVAIIGMALAILAYKDFMNKEAVAVTSVNCSTQGGVADDEYED